MKRFRAITAANALIRRGRGPTIPAITLPSTLGTDTFIINYDLSGTAQWTKTIRGSGNEQSIGIALDSTGIYVSGAYSSTSTVSLGNGVTLPISLGTDGLVVKYDLSGTAQWAKTIQGNGNDLANGIAVDSTGVYVTGNYFLTTGTVDLGNSVTLPTSVSLDAFIIKYNLSGVAQWAKAIQGTTANDRGYSIAIDSTGVYVSGAYSSTSAVDLGNSILLPISVGTTSDAFIIKYDLSGTAQWAKTIQGSAGNAGFAVTVDSTGVYVSGYYTSTSVLDLGNSITLPIAVSQDAFIIKYNLSGVAQWATTIQGESTDRISNMTVDSTGIYVTGYYYAPSGVSLGNGVTLPISTATGGDAFAIKYNLSGIAQWAKTIPANVRGNGLGITVDSTGVYVTGYYSSTSLVNLGNSITLPISVSQDGFVVKYNLSGVAQWAKAIQDTGDNNASDIAVDSTSVYVTGSYVSSSIVTL